MNVHTILTMPDPEIPPILSPALPEQQQRQPVYICSMPVPKTNIPEAKKIRAIVKNEFGGRKDCQVSPVKWADGICGFLIWAGDVLTPELIAECYRQMRNQQEELSLAMTHKFVS